MLWDLVQLQLRAIKSEDVEWRFLHSQALDGGEMDRFSWDILVWNFFWISNTENYLKQDGFDAAMEKEKLTFRGQNVIPWILIAVTSYVLFALYRNWRNQSLRRLNDDKMTSRGNDAACVAELQQQLANARLCADEARIAADQLKLDNNRPVALQPFFFFFRTDYMILQTFTVTSEHIRFYFLVFLFYTF